MTDLFDGLIGPLLAEEGGYSNDPADAGGETNWGVTVAVARASGYAGPMATMTRDQASAIYRARFWSAPGFDRVAALSARIAGKLFDMGVNVGVAEAATFLQRTLNVLNDQGADYADVPVDGDIGTGTLAALGALLRRRDGQGEAVVLKALNCLQGAKYIALAEARAADERFEFGWLSNRIAALAA